MEYDNELDATALEPPSDLHNFAKARMVTVGDPGFSRLFVGSMSPFRAEAAPPSDSRSCGRSASPSCGARNAYRTNSHPSPPWQPRSRQASHIGVRSGSALCRAGLQRHFAIVFMLAAGMPGGSRTSLRGTPSSSCKASPAVSWSSTAIRTERPLNHEGQSEWKTHCAVQKGTLSSGLVATMVLSLSADTLRPWICELCTIQGRRRQSSLEASPPSEFSIAANGSG